MDGLWIWGLMVMSNLVLHQEDDFELIGEDVDGQLFIHCTVHKFNKSVLKQMREVFEVVQEQSKEVGYNEIFSYTSNPKFAKLFVGVEYITSIDSLGKTYEVFKWD